MDRRKFLIAGAYGATVLSAATAAAVDRPTGVRLGLLQYSYGIKAKAESDQGFSQPLRFIEFAHQTGAIAVQTSLGVRTNDDAIAIRRLCDQLEMKLEGIVSPPKATQTDIDRFVSELATARECGAKIVRTVLSSGRRYEIFNQASDFTEFSKQAEATLQRAVPIAAQQKMVLAVENHKDYRADEQIELLKRISSEWVGVCLDTGNNLALLEDPHAVVDLLAPFTKTVHLKDIGVEESPEGFRMSEVPLGRGAFDLPRMVAAVHRANPHALFQLEMITRDPLLIPCLTDKYWATMGDVRGTDLARTLARVRKETRPEPLPRISKLNQSDQIAAEDRHVLESFEFSARTNLIPS